MLVKELIEKLQAIPDKNIMVCFADFEPIRAVYPCQLGEKVYACITDNEMFQPSVDIDEQMHEQQEMNETWAERQAEFYEDCLANGEIPF